MLRAGCWPVQTESDAVAPLLLLDTSPFGDVCAGLPVNNNGQWGPPDTVPNITSDVLAVKQKFGNQPGSASARAELGGARDDPNLDFVIDISMDVLYAKEALGARRRRAD